MAQYTFSYLVNTYLLQNFLKINGVTVVYKVSLFLDHIAAVTLCLANMFLLIYVHVQTQKGLILDLILLFTT